MQAYLSFDGNAAEALDFYAKVLGGKITLQHDNSAKARWRARPPPEAKDQAHARHAGGAWPPADGVRHAARHALRGPQGLFAVGAGQSDAKAGEQLFNALAEGGKVTMPYGATFWAAGFGMLIDKFGVPWMVKRRGDAGGFKPA